MDQCRVVQGGTTRPSSRGKMAPQGEARLEAKMIVETGASSKYQRRVLLFGAFTPCSIVRMKMKPDLPIIISSAKSRVVRGKMSLSGLSFRIPARNHPGHWGDY